MGCFCFGGGGKKNGQEKVDNKRDARTTKTKTTTNSTTAPKSKSHRSGSRGIKDGGLVIMTAPAFGNTATTSAVCGGRGGDGGGHGGGGGVCCGGCGGGGCGGGCGGC
ncbi:uncharacterized protein LOC107485368 [Arachis duranensis]|uniref:Uncharacterized protein LOC107485368 n=1 Tax=Arachis duranensis TaxID=130453 RepID=A0A6P4D5W7_ARADU|nr:uncharacterized protein LOC107485368 [Arachis duranensis]